jgi:hypothetical protein
MPTYKTTQRWRAKARKWINEYCGGKCQCCGYDKYHGNLAFHHVNPNEKDNTLSRMINATVGWSKILKEADKCVLVCHNCHGEIHAGLIECPSIDHKSRAAALKRIEDSKPIPKCHKFNFCSSCGVRIGYRNKTCLQCKYKTKIDWPNDLPDLVKKSSKLAVAKELGVSDKAVAKRLKNHHGWD